jgi:hypothetical protein
MATEILDGSNGNILVTINSIEFKCVINRWSADIVREFTEKTTFCTGGWRSRDPGMKQLVGRMDGYLSKGFAGSDPLALIAADDTDGLPFVLQADTGCYFSGNCHIGLSHAGSNAQLNSEMGQAFESDGAVSTFWVVA